MGHCKGRQKETAKTVPASLATVAENILHIFYGEHLI